MGIRYRETFKLAIVREAEERDLPFEAVRRKNGSHEYVAELRRAGLSLCMTEADHGAQNALPGGSMGS